MATDQILTLSEQPQSSQQAQSLPDPNYTTRLWQLLQAANISSFRALSRTANVSLWQVGQLRQGKAAQMRVDVLHRLSQALQISLIDLLSAFSELHSEPQVDLPQAVAPIASGQPPAIEQLEQEYRRLQAQMQQQQEVLQQEFQRSTLQILETWLTHFPALIYAAQQNEQLPAKNFLPFMRPLEQLLKAWEIESIAPVGTEIPFDPRMHQPLQGTIPPGATVRVRYAGYRQGEKLLYRAKVSLV